MCIFCKIVKGEMPSYKIYEDEKTYAFLDISDDAIGHTLVIPKAHYENIMEVSEEDLSAVMSTVRKVAKHYVDNCGYTGVNLMNASGVSAQQSVFHLHIHIIPRVEGDGLDTWPKMDKKNADLQAVYEKMKML